MSNKATKPEAQKPTLPMDVLEDDTPTLEEAGLEVVDGARSRSQKPVVEGAIVIYKGGNRKKVVALNGRMFIDEIETGDKEADGSPIMHVTKEAGDEGTQVYHFQTHDIRGKLIKQWLTPLTGSLVVGPPSKPIVVIHAKQLPEALRGRPFETCEHPEHLRVFLRMRNAARESEFTILVPPGSRAAFDQYVRLREARLGYESEQLNETVSA